jgi:glycine cleavage system aminomethyltransferase T/glycine/D-amino acid oxidase-like deaminating enzyme
MSNESDLPARAETLVVGAGFVGCSTAYHLAELGYDDVVVVDRGPLPRTGGTSSYAPGGVFQTAPDETSSVLARKTRELAQDCGVYDSTGSVEVATTERRLRSLDRRMDQAAAWGLDGAERLSPDDVAERFPLVDADRVLGGYHLPTDGRVASLEFLAELRARAEDLGVRFRGQTTVTDVEADRGRVETVVTDRGAVTVSNVVVAANVWTPRIGHMVGVDVPLAPVVHQYAVTRPVPELAGIDRDLPWLRHPDGGIYARRHGDSLGIGNYNNDPTVVDPGAIEGPGDSRTGTSFHDDPGSGERFAQPASRPLSEDQFAPASEAMVDVAPVLEKVGVATGVDALLAVTPDGNPILGQTPDLDGFWVGAGVRATHAGGAGKVLAELVDGTAGGVDVDPWHVARFQPHSGSPRFVREQARATYAADAGVPESAGIETAGRTLRESPFYRFQDALDAEFYDLRYGGWKRPMRFGTNESLLEAYDVPDRAGRDDGWSPVEAVEHLAVRDRVGICDLTSFSTFDVVGPGAPAFCQRVFSNDVDLPVGGVTYTLLLDEAGGIHGDMTVVRRAHDRFHAISNSGGAGTKQLARLRSLAADDESVTVTNRIGGRCGVSVTGPDAREVLELVVEASLDADDFPYFSAAETYVGEVPALALRVSYVGELGWEFHTSMEYGAELWETLWQAGTDHGLVPFGDGALVTMRLEKGFPAYGVDVSPASTPLEAGVEHAVDFDTEFVGRDALVAQREDGLERQRAVLTLDDPDAVVGSGTPVFDGDDRIGHVTSAGEGYSVGEFVLYAYVPPGYVDPGTGLEIGFENERYAATVRQSVLFDPERERLLG